MAVTRQAADATIDSSMELLQSLGKHVDVEMLKQEITARGTQRRLEHHPELETWDEIVRQANECGEHQLYILGHDPILGWLFGTVNILTDIITTNDFQSRRVQRNPKMIILLGNIPITTMLQESQERKRFDPIPPSFPYPEKGGGSGRNR